MNNACPFCAEERSLRFGAERAEQSLAAERDELLATTKALLEAVETDGRLISFEDAVESARAAIAKATGAA